MFVVVVVMTVLVLVLVFADAVTMGQGVQGQKILNPHTN